MKLQNSVFWYISIFMLLSAFSLPMASAKEFLGYCFEDNFDTAMVGLERDRAKYNGFLTKTSDKLIMGKIKNQYHNFVANIEDLYSPEPRIPKIIHQIWVGPHPFPKEAKAWQETWQNLHPDWEYKLWTNEDVELLDFENITYYNEAKNWGEKADILRYEILYRFGGLYADIDQSCLKPFDILHHTCDFYTGVHALPLMLVKNNVLRIANGVIAAAPGHPFLKLVVEEIKNNRRHNDLLLRTGPDFFTKMIVQAWDQSCALGNVDMVFPANYFYPCAERAAYQFKINAGMHVYVKPETLGIQYYTSYWKTPPTN